MKDTLKQIDAELARKPPLFGAVTMSLWEISRPIWEGPETACQMPKPAGGG